MKRIYLYIKAYQQSPCTMNFSKGFFQLCLKKKDFALQDSSLQGLKIQTL
jgi:hypothetical protein